MLDRRSSGAPRKMPTTSPAPRIVSARSTRPISKRRSQESAVRAHRRPRREGALQPLVVPPPVIAFSPASNLVSRQFRSRVPLPTIRTPFHGTTSASRGPAAPPREAPLRIAALTLFSSQSASPQRPPRAPRRRRRAPLPARRARTAPSRCSIAATKAVHPLRAPSERRRS